MILVVYQKDNNLYNYAIDYTFCCDIDNYSAINDALKAQDLPTARFLEEPKFLTVEEGISMLRRGGYCIYPKESWPAKIVLRSESDCEQKRMQTEKNIITVGLKKSII